MLNNMKTLIGLLIVIVGVAYWVSQGKNSAESSQHQSLFPDWQQDEALISGIDQVVLTQNSEQLVLVKTANKWQLNGGFYASIEPLFKLMQSLKTAEIIETKTSNPARHAQLELADDDLIVSLFQKNQLQHALHIGKKTAGGLTFVRRAGEDQTYTVKGLEPVSFNADNWALKTVLDIAADEVQAVTIKSVDGEVIALNRNLENGVMQLLDIPEGFQLQTDAYLDQLAGGLARLMIDEAVPAESWPTASEVAEITEVKQQLSATYQLNSGKEIKVEVYQQAEDYYLTIASSLYPQYEDWVMKIAAFKFKALNRKLSEFIEPIDDPSQPTDDKVVESSSE